MEKQEAEDMEDMHRINRSVNRTTELRNDNAVSPECVEPIFSDTSNDEGDEESESEEYGPLRRQKWTEHSKLLLLKALKKHGHANIQRIWEELPNKSLTSIVAMINKLKAQARRTQSNNSSLNPWIASDLFPKEESITQALLFIHLFEEHPKESTYDYGAVYYLLHKLSVGETPQHLSEETQKMFYTVLQKIIGTECENGTAMEEIFRSLGEIYKKKECLRTYSRKNKRFSSMTDTVPTIDGQN